MKTIAIQAFSVNELDPAAKSKVLDKYREINMFDDWFHPIEEGFKEDLAEFGVEATAYFSGFYSQGDGASFQSSTVDTDVLIRKLFESGYKIPENALLDSKNLSVTITRNSNIHYHEYTMDINVYDEGFTLSDSEHEDLVNAIESWAHEMATNFYENLQNYYEELISDEEVTITLEENEYMFTANGQVIPRQ